MSAFEHPAELPPTDYPAEGLTLPDMMDRAASENGNGVALHWQRGGLRESPFVTFTYTEYRERVLACARSLVALGVPAGGCVSVQSFNCPYYSFVLFGATYAGAMCAGVYTTNSAAQSAYVVDHSESRVVFVEDHVQMRKMISQRGGLPHVRRVVQFFGDPAAELAEAGDDAALDALRTGWVMTYDEFERAGEGAAPDSGCEEESRRRRAQVAPDDVAGLIYTSGTTGTPKAVMLTHRNYTFQVAAIQSVYRFGPEDRMLSYLPLSHIAAQMVEVFGPVCAHSQVWFARPDALKGSLRETLLAARPTMFLGVPRVWEKLHEAMLAAGRSTPLPVRWLASWAKSVGLAAAYARQNGESGPWFGGVANLLTGKARAAIGLDQCRLFYSGAAPIARETVEYFMSLGIHLHEVYGMSECAGITSISFDLPGLSKVGTVGKAEPGTELRIAEDGEVQFRGPHVFRGYFKDPASTAEAVDSEGWLHSGDLGYLDEHGFLVISGRKKELLITGGGENIPPLLLEAALTSIPAIGQAVAIGDRRKFVSALVTLRAGALPGALREAGCSESLTPAEAAVDPRFLAYLQEQVDAVNRARMPSRAAYVQKITVIPEEFTVDNGVLTATHKIMRRVVNTKYAAEIEAMYADVGPAILPQ